MLLLRSPAEGALAAVAGGLLPQATTRFGRYMDGEAATKSPRSTCGSTIFF